MSYLTLKKTKRKKKKRYERLSRSELQKLASNDKLKAYGVNGKSKSVKIIEALYERDEVEQDKASKQLAKKQSKQNRLKKISDAVQIVVRMIEDGETVDLTKPNIYGMTPLMAACRSGLIDAVQFFLDQGADANQSDEFDSTPIIFATINGFDDIVKLLLQNGADPSLTDVMNKNALDFAKEKGHKKIVNMLKRKGVVPAKKTRGLHKYRHRLNLIF